MKRINTKHDEANKGFNELIEIETKNQKLTEAKTKAEEARKALEKVSSKKKKK